MSATINSTPTDYASAYRPMEFTVTRTNPSASQVAYIRPATASDVSTLGSGLQVGDILVSHGDIQGPVAAAVGQTVIFNDDNGDYAGVWEVLNSFEVGGSKYMVIDAPDYGALTPPGTATVRVWLDNYRIHIRLQVYTTMGSDPEAVDIGPCPVDDDGVARVDVSRAIQRKFQRDISTFAKEVPPNDVVQSAHGLTSLAYTYVVAETYTVVGSTAIPDPFDGSWTVGSSTTKLVAVNAVHPYVDSFRALNNTVVDVDWTDTDLTAFRVGGSTSRFLTLAPRRMEVGSDDRFRLHILVPRNAGLFPFTAWELRVYRATETWEVDSLELTKNVTLAEEATSVSLAVGPADLDNYVTVPERYFVVLMTSGGAEVSESFGFHVNTRCTPAERPVQALNLLGGVDHFTFRGSEQLVVSSTKETHRKPMGNGSGYDWQERVHRSVTARGRRLISGPLNKDMQEWAVTTFTSSPLVTMNADNTLPVPVVVLTTDAEARRSAPGLRRVVLDVREGVHQQAQEL